MEIDKALDKLTILDMGGVLVDLNRPSESMRLGIPEAEFWELWTTSEAVHAYEIGALETPEFYRRFCGEVGLSESDFRVRFNQWLLKPYSGIERLLGSLKNTCRIALLSNTNEHHWEQINDLTDAFSLFDQHYLSFRSGQMKPSRQSFEQVVDHYAISLEKVYFFDDTKKNVEAARDVGLQAHLVCGIDELVSCATGLGLLQA